MKPKNIDRLIQEQLKNIEASPNPKVWSAIEARLIQKKRRILPIWWISGSIAALLLVSFFVSYFSNETNKLPHLKIDEIITEIESVKSNQKQQKTIKNEVKNTIYNVKQPFFVENTQTNKKKNSEKIKQKPPVLLTEKSYLLSSEKPVRTSKKIVTIDINVPKDIILKSTTKNSVVSNKNSTNKKEIKTTKINQKIAITKQNLIANKTIESSVKNSKKKRNKWTLSPVVAVVNSVAFSNHLDADVGNPTDEFSPVSGAVNNKENNKAYGVKIAYQFHKKWALQSGVHLQKHRFSAQNISIVSNTSTGTISYYQSDATNFIASLGIASALLNTNAVTTKTYNYIEIPLEITYNVVTTKKFNTQVVAGFSTLFLTTNNTSIVSDTFFNYFGKDSNLKSLNFSGNIGVDFNYSLSKKWQLNLNPMLKKQFNTFTNTPSGFNPYSLSIYTGVSYRF